MTDQESIGGLVSIPGSRVLLKRFDASHITPVYLEWLNDAALMRYSNQRFRKHTETSCLSYLATFEDSDNLFLSIYHGEQFIGTMTAYISRVHQAADMGLLIGTEGQGKGLGLDAWSTLMRHLFEHGMRKVSGGTLRCNAAMVRIMEKSGMAADGVRLRHELVDGVAQDILHFAKFRT
jgi:RimJ/RimL family protein N-acetyltransferase